LPRLLQEAEHAGAVDGGDESGGIGEAGEDDPGHVGLEIAKLLQQLDAGHFRHALVGDDDVEGGGLGDLQRFVAGLRLVNPITRFEEVAQDGQVGLLIIDDEDSASTGLPNAVQRDERAQSLVQHRDAASPFDCSKGNF